MDTTKMWDYRVVRKESADGSDEWYSVQEVYYDDETGEPMAQTVDLQVEGDTITGMRTQLERMLKSLDEPVVDESDIVNDSEGRKTIEDRVLELEMENAEMRDRLDELGERAKEYIYESPDNGKTVYRRKVGETIKENIDKLRGL